MHTQALSVATCLDAVHLCVVLSLQFKPALPMLDIYQEMLLNCVRLVVPMEKKNRGGGGGKCGWQGLFHVREHQHQSVTQKYIDLTKIVNFTKYPMLSTLWLALRAALSRGSIPDVWCLEENKKIQCLTYVHQRAANSRYCSGAGLFPSCLQWWGLSLFLIFASEKPQGRALTASSDSKKLTASCTQTLLS